MENKKTTQIQGVQLSCAEDVINWLEYLLKHHDLSTAECMKADWSKEVTVYTDQVIKGRYSGMIEWLKDGIEWENKKALREQCIEDSKYLPKLEEV